MTFPEWVEPPLPGIPAAKPKAECQPEDADRAPADVDEGVDAPRLPGVEG